LNIFTKTFRNIDGTGIRIVATTNPSEKESKQEYDQISFHYCILKIKIIQNKYIQKEKKKQKSGLSLQKNEKR